MLFHSLLTFHSMLRWLVLAALFFTAGKALMTVIRGGQMSEAHYQVARGTQWLVIVATLIGFVLYADSPVVHYYFRHSGEVSQTHEARFFGILHPFAMLMLPVVTSGAIFLLKRDERDDASLLILVRYFGLAFMLALVSNPWPIGELIHRPLLR